MDIPYEKNPGNACALACYTMTSRYFFPEITFEQIAKISNWTPGYVVWAFKFWLWIMDRGIEVVDYDIIDLQTWARKGIDGLKENISKKELEYYIEHTKDIESYSDDIKKVLAHPNFTHKQAQPTMNDLLTAFNSGAVCEVTLNSASLDQLEGFTMHRVVVLDIDDKYIIFHDPRKNKFLPKRKEIIKFFKKVWLEKIDGPELCIYKYKK